MHSALESKFVKAARRQSRGCGGCGKKALRAAQASLWTLKLSNAADARAWRRSKPPSA